MYLGRLSHHHPHERALQMKYTFLSKWTVLILTLITAGLIVLSVLFFQGQALAQNSGLGLLAILVAFVVYAIAWIVALADSIQEKRWGWMVALIILLPILIGPLLYSLIGPRNTR